MTGAQLTCPIAWAARCARLRGHAFALGVLLWTLSRGKHNRRVQLELKWLQLLGISKSAERRALLALEGAELIAVARHPGRRPLVTLIDLSTKQEEELQTWLMT